MANYHNVEDIKKHLTKQANEYRARIELWEKVTRATKKDGSDFSVFGKNFIGAKYGQASYMGLGHNELTVSGWIGSVWVDDSLAVYCYSDDFNKSDARYNINHSVYTYSVDECFIKVAEYIEKLKSHLNETEREISICDEVFKAFDEKMRDAWQELKTACGCEGLYKNSLYYAIRDYVNNRYY